MLPLLLATTLFSLDGTNQIDMDSVKRMGNVVTVRMATSGLKLDKDPRIANALSDLELDCTAHKARIVDSFYFDQGYKLVNKTPPHDSKLTPYTDDSVFALVEAKLCDVPALLPAPAPASTK
ncbi:hypothetical protein HNQ50_001878 [Silvimonas terrae]|uniref:Surface-adhesin protein E-like domain-containing protein n=1 Tax=Silvimonas terrae TaxID=300266 RepID=A0A840RCT3_9NEIS|nr:surface-adhesin E family protein [Silvimonas terrae]MBB5191155.1 hypothetical protein [Silvimonas terrae]